MKLVFALVAVGALVAPASAGEVYRWLDGGTVVYSDQPPQDGAVVTAMPAPEPLPIVTAPDGPPAEMAAGDATGSSPLPQHASSPLPQNASSGLPQHDTVVSTAPATVEDILEITALRAHLPYLVRELGAGYFPRSRQLAGRESARVTQIVARHFTPEPIFTAIRDEFRRGADARQLAAMAAWFRSPLGRKITGLEVAAATPDIAPKIAAFAAGLKTSPPASSRLELVQRLDWVTGMNHDTTELAVAIMARDVRAATVATVADRPLRLGRAERRIAETQPQLAALLEESATTRMLYVYAPLSDAELMAYADFLGSPAGRAYSQLTHAALLRAVGDAADRTATEVARAVAPARWAAAQKAAVPSPVR